MGEYIRQKMEFESIDLRCEMEREDWFEYYCLRLDCFAMEGLH